MQFNFYASPLFSCLLHLVSSIWLYMHHSFIDRYSDGASPIHRLGASLKIFLIIVSLICIIITPYRWFALLAIYAFLIGLAWMISRVPPAHLFKRLRLIVPFIAIIALGAFFAEGPVPPLGRYLLIVCKSILAIAVLTMLTSTTRFPDLLKGFSRLGMPRILVAILAFLYRYIFILIDEAERLNIGRLSRHLSSSRRLAWKGRAWMMGTLFVRSIDKSERVYQAMLARGFTGEIK